MQVIGLTTFGGPDVLRPLEIPKPHAGPGEVRIRVRAAAVNPVDAIIRAGGFAGNDQALDEPVVPGTDIVGVVDEVGPDQPEDADVTLGDDAIGFVAPSGSHGGYSEYVVLPALSVTRKPDSLDDASAVSFLSNALTAAIALENLRLADGATLAVTGATGAVGGFLVELAARQGITVIVAARPDETDLVRGFGAAHVIARDSDFVQAVRELTDGRGADALADPAILTGKVVDAVRGGGQVAFFLPTDIELGRGIRVFNSYVMLSNTRHDVIADLVQLAGTGEITPRVAGVLPAVDAARAHTDLEQGGVRGRLVLEF
jgi:NADPH:quinone reductase